MRDYSETYSVTKSVLCGFDEVLHHVVADESASAGDDDPLAQGRCARGVRGRGFGPGAHSGHHALGLKRHRGSALETGVVKTHRWVFNRTRSRTSEVPSL